MLQQNADYVQPRHRRSVRFMFLRPLSGFQVYKKDLPQLLGTGLKPAVPPKLMRQRRTLSLRTNMRPADNGGGPVVYYWLSRSDALISPFTLARLL